MSYQRKDPFYKKAKDKGYRARSSFKLKQIQKKFSIMKRGDLVVDLGAAPVVGHKLHLNLLDQMVL